MIIMMMIGNLMTRLHSVRKTPKDTMRKRAKFRKLDAEKLSRMTPILMGHEEKGLTTVNPFCYYELQLERRELKMYDLKAIKAMNDAEAKRLAEKKRIAGYDDGWNAAVVIMINILTEQNRNTVDKLRDLIKRDT